MVSTATDSAREKGLEELRRSTAAVGALSSARDNALDFTKGVLVLFMILYHWTNYFVSVDGDIYRYLRFITPSFVFITGYLVSQVYLPKYADDDRQLYARLLKRGAKLLLLFTVLNVLALSVISSGLEGVRAFVQSAYAIYIGGNARVAFDVLVPIAYFLMLSPLMVTLHYRSHKALSVISVAILSLALALNAAGRGSVILELVAFGVLGMLIGSVGQDRINKFVHRPSWFTLAYGVYLVAITKWDVLLPLQVVGACLSVLLIYVAATKVARDGGIQRHVIALGRYSLFAYIVHILVLRSFRVGIGTLEPTGTVVFMLFLATIALTVLTVQATIFARSRSRKFDKLYRAVLA